MKKTLVIHPDDPSTDFLYDIYRDLNYDMYDEWVEHSMWEMRLIDIIPYYDRIIMVGHGCPEGLFGSHYDLVINEEHVDALRDKELICIWCNADQFMAKYNLTGFYSGMFISEVGEARVYKIDATQEQIDESNNLFSMALGQYIDSEDRLRKVLKMYGVNNDKVVNFNRERLFDTDYDRMEVMRECREW